MKQGNKILIFLAVYLGVGAAFCCYCKKLLLRIEKRTERIMELPSCQMNLKWQRVFF